MNQIRRIRNDGYMNLLSGLGAPGLDRSVMGSFTGRGWSHGLQRYWASRFSSYNLGEYYFGHGLAQTIVDRPADDSVQRGVDIEGDDDDVMSDEYDRLSVLSKTADAVRWARLYGGAILLLVAKDGGDFTDPLNLDTLEEIVEIRVYDVTCVKNPGLYYTDPNNPDTFGKIEIYTITPPGAQSFDVHETRIIPVSSDPIPVGYTSIHNIPWLGRPVLTACIDDLERYYQALQWAARLIERKQQAVWNMNGLGEAFANGEDEIVKNRINMVDLVRGNLNSVVVDKDDTYAIQNLGLDGLQALIDTFEISIAADAKMPVVVLFGKATRGLNTTGAGDLEAYYGMVGQIQRVIVKPVLEKLTSILYVQKSLNGQIPDDWQLEFNPLWQPTAQEQANTDNLEQQGNTSKVNTLMTLMNNSILSPEEVRKIVVNEIYPDYEFEDTLPSTGDDINYAEGVDTSMLDVPGTSDPNVPPGQSRNSAQTPTQ